MRFFRFVLSEISSSSILRDLIHSFRIERPSVPVRSLPWDLAIVLTYLRSSAFEPLDSASLRQLTIKTLFLVSLATAKRVGELQLFLKRSFFFSGKVLFLSYLPEFRAETDSEANPLPRHSPFKSLDDLLLG